MNILIIGAAGGIGSHLLLDLAKDSSHNILVGYHKNMVETPHKSFEMDASKFEDVENFITKGLEEFNSIDAIINLPGNLILKPAHLSTEEDFYNTININLKSSFGVVRSAGKLLNNCSLILMSTAAASIGLSNHELISSAKAGVEGLAKSAAKTYSRKNIRVNTVSPGLVNTPLSKKITSNPIILKASIKMLALDKIGEPKHISNMIKFLINPENDWITGQNFIVDGGLSSTK
tara:strand:- start:4058 stop:4756 length:699 start_codon:yes stop_codon:yes gene_type:complete